MTTQGIIALRMTILRTLEVIGAVVEDMLGIKHLFAVFLPRDARRYRRPLDTSVTEITPRFDMPRRPATAIDAAQPTQIRAAIHG